MTHELAKQLKDARFLESENNSHFEMIDDEPYHVPTLSELIEACLQPGYFSFRLKQFGKGWLASIIENSKDKSVDESTVKATGLSPEEAVARLWTALHSPKANVT